jgi:hypothetical protein
MAGETDALESIPGLLKRLQIRAQFFPDKKKDSLRSSFVFALSQSTQNQNQRIQKPADKKRLSLYLSV